MFEPSAKVVCTPAKVTNPEAVRVLLTRYDLTMGEVTLDTAPDGSTVLRISGEIWPDALSLDGFSREDLEAAIEEHGLDAVLGSMPVDDYHAAITMFGQRHLIQFLLDLARYLQEPLTLHAVEELGRGGSGKACVWHVKPRAEEVEVEFFPPEDRYLLKRVRPDLFDE